MKQWLLIVVLFGAGLWLYTRQNNFPFYYHADEPSKVEQIREGTRNFHHPLLLLSATDLVGCFAGATQDCQAIVERGRWCSAVFAAIAVAAFSWLGFLRYGATGGTAAGALMLLQRRPFELAHFMKEDCALLAGIALSFLALEFFFRQPNSRRAFALGLAVALAASAKYVGFLLLLPALVAIFAQRRGRLAFFAGFFLLVAAVNFRAFLEWPALFAGLRFEVANLHSQVGIETRYAPFGWLRYFLELSPFLLLGLAAHFLFLASDRRQRSLPQLLISAFPFYFGLLLCFSSKQAGRHALPLTEISALLAVFGFLEIWRRAQAQHLVWLSRTTCALLILAAIYDLARTTEFARGFQRDHRRELVEWIQRNVSANATIAVEDRVSIAPENSCAPALPLPQKMRRALFVADLGSLAQLRAEDVSYLAVSEARAGIFLKEKARASHGDDASNRRAEFYRQLSAEGELVWSRKTGRIGALNPGLRLYRIAPVATTRRSN